MDTLLKKLKLQFKDRELLERAFTHRSYLNEAGKNLTSNERLEFLGDAILSFVVSHYLYTTNPDQPEGVLTNMRSTIVKTKTLAEMAQSLDFGSYLRLSHGEEESGGRNNPSLLADTFEAFLGALFWDQGLAKTEEFLNTVLISKIPHILESKLHTDYKSKLQEVVQTFSRSAPTYKVVKTEGPDHAKTFWIAVVIDGIDKEVGKGSSKQEAEQDAAKRTLATMSKI